MFGFVSKKQYNSLLNDLETANTKILELTKNYDKAQYKIEILTEDNQDLRTINEFYIDRYRSAKNIIRILNNEKPDKINIPEKCPKCNAVLVYNEHLHIATCPTVDCNKVYRYDMEV